MKRLSQNNTGTNSTVFLPRDKKPNYMSPSFDRSPSGVGSTSDPETTPSKVELHNYNPNRRKDNSRMSVISDLQFIEDVRIGMQSFFQNAISSLYGLPSTKSVIEEMQEIFFGFLENMKDKSQPIPNQPEKSDGDSPTKIINAQVGLPAPIVELFNHFEYVLNNFMPKDTASRWFDGFYMKVINTFSEEINKIKERENESEGQYQDAADSKFALQEAYALSLAKKVLSGLEGKKDIEYKTVMARISNELQTNGFRAPFQITSYKKKS